jgi:hypothetical protein
MEVSGPTPKEPSYNSEFNQSVDLFEKSFRGMQSSTFDAQRLQYVKVMHESLEAMREAANAMFNQKLVALNKTLSNDLNEYLSSPTDEHLKKIQADLNKLKREES